MDHIFPSPLVRGVLLKRYKRFLADVELEDGTIVTAHCANTGSMKGCSEPNSPVYMSKSDNPKRKLAYSLELIQAGTTWVGINTALPNGIVESAIERRLLPQLDPWTHIRREVKYGKNSRIDLLLESDEAPPCYVEVKNVTLANSGVAKFPDAVTERGRKHLQEMSEEIAKGNRAAMVYLIQRTDCETFSPAEDIDPAYAEALSSALKNGVLAFALEAQPSPEGIVVTRSLPVHIP